MLCKGYQKNKVFPVDKIVDKKSANKLEKYYFLF